MYFPNLKLNNLNILITGGAGFIGSHLVKKILENTNSQIFNIDKLGYSSDLSLIKSSTEARSRHHHIKINLKDKKEVFLAVEKSRPNIVIHLAAESHVDRSIDNPSIFIESNILGTFNLLEASKNYWDKLPEDKKSFFRFHHVSTDEVFGSLNMDGKFDENSQYQPNSPYSASKAASDHLVRSWFHTYGLPTLISNCSNNFGPHQFPEKFIPLIINKALKNKKIPIYGNGANIRDWLYVEDHIDAILEIILNGIPGSTYCVGGSAERTNLQVAKEVCRILDKKLATKRSLSNNIEFVKDRPGHDLRYSINSSFIKKEIGWKPKNSFEINLQLTVDWYLNNQKWCDNALNKSGYKGERLGKI